MVTEFLIGGSGLTVGIVFSSTGLRSSVELPIAAASSFIASVAGLINNEYSSRRKMSFIKLRDWIKLESIL